MQDKSPNPAWYVAETRARGEAQAQRNLERLDDRGRVRVLLSMLGGSTPVAVRIGEVGPV